MRAAAARACRNPSKPIGFSTFSTSHVNKTYENTTLSHRKILKFCSRALAGSFKNQWFFNIYVTRGFAGNFSRARRTHSTTSARVPEAQSLSNNTMRGTCARPPCAHVDTFPNTLCLGRFRRRLCRRRCPYRCRRRRCRCRRRLRRRAVVVGVADVVGVVGLVFVVVLVVVVRCVVVGVVLLLAAVVFDVVVVAVIAVTVT